MLYKYTNQIQLINFYICQTSMFYINMNLSTDIYFPHQDLDLVANDKHIYNKLIGKLHNYCNQEYGFIINIAKHPQSKSQYGILIGKTSLAKVGCNTLVKFNCISFKPKKNEILCIFVNKITNEFIQGKIGLIQVLIPRSQMSQDKCVYADDKNEYILKNKVTQEERNIELDSKLYCTCFQTQVYLGQLKIMAKLDDRSILVNFYQRSQEKNGWNKQNRQFQQ